MTIVIDRPAGVPGPAPSGRPASPPPRSRPAARPPWPARVAAHLATEGAIVAMVAFVVYFVIAMLLDFTYHSFDPDSISRMANGFYVLHSRDPHLAAIGFVWNPLSSMADLPLLAFNSVWPALASHNVAGTTMSALAMTGATYQVNAVLREWKVNILPRLVMTALFALNPMILLFGGNGMSEALYLFAAVASTRYLLRWMRHGDLASLVYAGTALGVAYLERSEAVGAAVLAAPLVWWVTFARIDGDRRSRVWAGLTDATIFLIPIVTALVGWAVVSYVIVGQAFGQFTSKYGNAAQIAAAHFKTGDYGSRLAHEAAALEYLGPALPLIVILALLVAAYRRNVQLLGVVAVLGGCLAFTLVSYLDNAIFPWFRFYIVAIPIGVLLVGSMFASPTHLRAPVAETERDHGPPGDKARLRPGRLAPVMGAVLATVVAVVLLVPSMVGTAEGMMSSTIGPDELQNIGFIFHKHLDAQDVEDKNAYAAVLSLSGYIDNMHLPNGDIVVDNSDSCIPNVITTSGNPRVYVIPNDRDFQRTLADPLTFHAHYLLVQGEAAYSPDAVRQQYPNLGTGTSFAKLTHTFPAKGLCPTLRLYQVTGHPTGNY